MRCDLFARFPLHLFTFVCFALHRMRIIQNRICGRIHYTFFSFNGKIINNNEEKMIILCFTQKLASSIGFGNECVQARAYGLRQNGK